MYIGMPTDIASVSISPGWNEPGQQLVVTGTVLQRDGRTPARGVILYYWQTDATGLYAPGAGMHPGSEKHGHVRGWVRTDDSGKYEIRTIRPAPYPDDALPAHIHLVVKEPGLPNEYYIDDINFQDDTLLAPSLRKYPAEKRGGSGIVHTVLQDGILLARRDIVLGLNIPNYPN
jgi:protocatechuate 3,4-dioxygenase beta subunit